MTETLIKIIPLDLAATLSPGILALALIILGNKNHAKANLLAFFLGSLIIGLGLTILGFTLGNKIDTGTKQNLTEAIINLVLGIFLVFYGFKIYFTKEKKLVLKEETESKIFKWLGIGAIITITNFDADLLNFTAAKEIGGAEILTFEKIILLVIGLIFFTLPITLPAIIKLLFPKVANPMLEKLNNFVFKYSRYIVFSMFLIFGIYLFYRGIKFFI